jgi:release factor glutamine methyltransferase
MTVLEASRWAAEQLSGTGSPRTDADLLLCDLMQWKRHQLHLNSSRTLPGKVLGSYRRMVARRMHRVPLQHITGKAGFMGRTFLSGPEAMVPRPETEILLETVLKRLPEQPHRVLDIGTGSGVIALTLASEFPSALVTATDICEDALGLAARNRALHGVQNMVLAVMNLSDALSPPADRLFDLVTANLPYIPTGEIPGLQPEVKSGDPLLALDGGSDGMHLVNRCVSTVQRLLRPGGLMALEVGPGQAHRLADALDSLGSWADILSTRDLNGEFRVISAFRNAGSTD